jgi:hypothetical protein
MYATNMSTILLWTLFIVLGFSKKCFRKWTCFHHQVNEMEGAYLHIKVTWKGVDWATRLGRSSGQDKPILMAVTEWELFPPYK